MNTTPEDTLLNAIFTCDFGPGLDLASTIVGADDFIQTYNRKLWRAMLEVHARGEPLDCSCLVAQLMRGGQDERMSGDEAVNLLNRTMDGAPLKGFIEVYAKRVKDEAAKHRSAKAMELANIRLTEGEDPFWVKEELVDQLSQVDTDRLERRDVSLHEAMPKVMEAWMNRLRGDQTEQGLLTGIDKLDELMKGIHADELVIAGAMPGRGKSAFGLQLAYGLISKGIGVYLISLEMSRRQISERLLKMKFGGLLENPGKRCQEILDYGEDLRTMPLYMNDASSLDAQQVASYARLAVSRYKVRLVIVDYLQLIRMPAGKERREAVGDATNILRMVAKETHVPVLVMSQLRRPTSLNNRASMIDLKESGDIEAHAHVVLLMHRPVDEDDGRFTGEDEIIIGKQREGPTGTVDVIFDKEYVKFRTRYTGKMESE